jgi:hydroxypyruvate isomerase
MKRKSFIRRSLLGSVSVLGGASLLPAGAAKAAALAHSDPGQPFNLNYATHDGMFRNSAGDNFVDQIKFAYDQGFRSIEDNGMAKRPVEQ